MEKIQSCEKYVLSKSESQLEDALHKTTKFVDWCIQHDVKHVVIGNLEGVQRNTKKKETKRNESKIIQLVFWKIIRLY